MIFNVTLNKEPFDDLLTVQYQVITYTGEAFRAIRARITNDGNQSAVGDFRLSPGELNFVPGGDLTQSIEVEVIGDDTVELDEEFYVGISIPETALAVIDTENSFGTGIIRNDDEREDPTPKPFIYVQAEDRTIDEGDPAVFLVRAIRPTAETPEISGISLDISQSRMKT